MRDLFIGDTFIGEDVRAYAMALQIGQPTHPNAWGAMFRSFICAELKTGRVERCGMANVKDPVSHASLCPQYRKLT